MTASERPKTRILLPPSRRGPVLALALATAMGVSAAVAQVWTHQRVIELGYEISRETKERDQLQEQNRRLRIELEILKSPDRIGRIAANVYGMRPPEPEQMHRLRARARKKDPVVGSLQRRQRRPLRRAAFGGQP